MLVNLVTVIQSVRPDQAGALTIGFSIQVGGMVIFGIFIRRRSKTIIIIIVKSAARTGTQA